MTGSTNMRGKLETTTHCSQVRLSPAAFEVQEDAEDPYEAERSVAMVMPAFLSDAEVEQIHQAGAAAELKDPRGGQGGEFQVSHTHNKAWDICVKNCASKRPLFLVPHRRYCPWSCETLAGGST